MAGNACSECWRKSWREACVGVISIEVTAEALGAHKSPQGSAGVTRRGKGEHSTGEGKGLKSETRNIQEVDSFKCFPAHYILQEPI